MEIICKDRVFTLKNGSDVLLHTDANTPMVYVGYGEERVEMYRGNFKLEDHLLERRPLTLTSARVTEQGTELDLEGQLKLLVTEKEGAVTLMVAEKAEGINRFWLHVEAAEDEHVYGCGEQMSYFDLRGRHFPLWSSEPGVGISEGIVGIDLQPAGAASEPVQCIIGKGRAALEIFRGVAVPLELRQLVFSSFVCI